MTPIPEGAPTQQQLRARVAPAAAGVAQNTVIGDAPFDATVSAVSYEPDATITGVVTNNRVFNLINRGQDGLGAVVVATITFAAGTNIAAADEGNVALSGTPANLNVNAGDVLSLQEAINGTGLANPGGNVKVTLSRR